MFSCISIFGDKKNKFVLAVVKSSTDRQVGTEFNLFKKNADFHLGDNYLTIIHTLPVYLSVYISSPRPLSRNFLGLVIRPMAKFG